QNRFGGNGLYILDEPEAALSPMRLLALMAEINALVKKDSQFIIATHSPILMAFPGAEILELSDDGIKRVSYRDTEHYRITKSFLDNPEKMLHYLLSEDDV
ncbi:MAG: AAA family ATPase, partial [Clostridia bacterium]|nr:AAA family ATPase [Clostridia bacterium]MBQ2826071.1 AAA family ATPase [Clostridia bacterium]